MGPKKFVCREENNHTQKHEASFYLSTDVHVGLFRKCTVGLPLLRRENNQCQENNSMQSLLHFYFIYQHLEQGEGTRVIGCFQPNLQGFKQFACRCRLKSGQTGQTDKRMDGQMDERSDGPAMGRMRSANKQTDGKQSKHASAHTHTHTHTHMRAHAYAHITLFLPQHSGKFHQSSEKSLKTVVCTSPEQFERTISQDTFYDAYRLGSTSCICLMDGNTVSCDKVFPTISSRIYSVSKVKNCCGVVTT